MTAIIYSTNTGSSEKYARMLSEKTGYPCYSLTDSNVTADEIIFIGWVMAGAIQGLAAAKERFQNIMAVAAVGLLDTPNQVKELSEKNGITEPLVFLPGAFDMKKLTGMHKMMMGMMMKMIKGKLKDNPDPKAKEIVKKFEEGFDSVSEENLQRLLDII